MAEVYKYAAVTIVPTAAISCHDGFLHKRRLRSARIPYIHPVHSDSDGHLLLQLTEQPQTHWDHDIEYSWWNCRGWTLQERFLSRRILHFSHSRFYFECKIAHLARTEGGSHYGMVSPMSQFNIEALPTMTGEEYDSDFARSTDEEIPPQVPSLSEHITSSSPLDYEENESVGALSQTEGSDSDHSSGSSDWDIAYRPFCTWYQEIQCYSDRIFTYCEDKFPAAEGLARDLAARCNVGRYLAGIWENELVLGLLWKPGKTSPIQFTSRVWSWPPSNPQVEPVPSYFSYLDPPAPRPTKYRAPSWSWASLDMFTHWPGTPHNDYYAPEGGTIEMLDGEIELLDADLQLEGSSAFGKLTGGHLTLKGKYLAVSISGPLDSVQIELVHEQDPEQALLLGQGFDYRVLHDDHHVGYAALDFGLDPSLGGVFALKLVNQPPGLSKRIFFSGMIVQESQERRGVYLRRGVFALRENHLDVR